MAGRSSRSWLALLLAMSILVGAPVGVDVEGTATEPGPNESTTPAEDVTTPARPAAADETAWEVDDEQNGAFLRVAHVSPDAPPVDVYVEGERVLADVSVGDVSDYLTLPADEYSVRFTPAGDEETTIFEGDVPLAPREASTLFAAGEVGEVAAQPFEPVLYEDDPVVPASDVAAVSISHMSPDAPAIDATTNDGDAVLAENVTFGEASQYATVPAGDHEVELRPATADNDGEVFATVDLSLEGGTAYSAATVGYLNGGSDDGETFRVELVEDASKTVHLPSGTSDDAGAGEERGEPTNETGGDE